jgi:glycine dehydrogenase
MVGDLTGLPLANASLLDEATAAAEAMHMCVEAHERKRKVIVCDAATHPQTLAVVATRSRPLGVEVRVVPRAELAAALTAEVAGVLLSYPTTDGAVYDERALIAAAHAVGVRVVMATDLLALTVLTPPGELGADIAIGSAQRFGVPMGFGGPHAAFLATTDAYRRLMPGRIIGVSQGRHRAHRLSPRAADPRATHPPREGDLEHLHRAGAARGHGLDVRRLSRARGPAPRSPSACAGDGARSPACAGSAGACAGRRSSTRCGRSRRPPAGRGARAPPPSAASTCGASTTASACRATRPPAPTTSSRCSRLRRRRAAVRRSRRCRRGAGAARRRWSARPSFLTHETFHRYHSEHEMLRYLHRLEHQGPVAHHVDDPARLLHDEAQRHRRDDPGDLARVRPHASVRAGRAGAGYRALFTQLEAWLAEITGFAAVSLQPNAGAQGEYAGLLAIRAYHEPRRHAPRRVPHPVSAHGTNPASAVMAGFEVVPVATAADGNIDLADLRAKAAKHADNAGAI